MRVLVSLFCGGLFGAGLVISGMTNTLRVQGFLDLFGMWDPTLMFVMGGAIIPMLFAWQIAARRKISVLGGAFPAPHRNIIDKRLVVGSILFGMGWGLSGFCPGPAFASLSFSGASGLVFVVSMLIAMLATKPLSDRLFKQQ